MFEAVAEPGRIWPALNAVCVDGQAPTLYLRGRGVGGSSAVNAQVTIRGLPSDYDRWAAQGCSSWGWDGVRSAFARVRERIPVERRPEAEWSTFDRSLAAACVDRGHPRCDSYETEGVLGVAVAGLTRRGGRRVSTNDAYLEIRGDVLVHRVIVENRRAIGVRTSDGNVMARHVVISAGAIHSPAILLRSGLDAVRPAIGRNLAEHPKVTVNLTVDQSVIDRDGDCPATGFILRWSSGVASCGEGDLQILPLNYNEAPGLVRVVTAVMEPFSCGKVTLASDDPAIDPRIEFRLLSDACDMVRIRLAAQELFALLNNDKVRAPTRTVTLDERGTAPGDLKDPAALDAWLKANVADYVHATGTCRMGAPNDPSSVVDPHCRFIGLEGLSVVDASIVPTIPRANTHLTAVMIAEKAASFLALTGASK